jgi:hypothetical protein
LLAMAGEVRGDFVRDLNGQLALAPEVNKKLG